MLNDDLYDDLIRKARLVEAYSAARLSPDPRTQVGVVIYENNKHITSAYNGFPDYRLNKADRLLSSEKNHYMLHAEQAGCLNALKERSNLLSCIMYGNYLACIDCAKVIIHSGIRQVVRHSAPRLASPKKWRDSIDFADGMMLEAGIEIIEVDGVLGVDPVWFDGELRSF